MNKESRKILMESGWYEGKKIDITEIIAIYKREGIELSQKEKEYMEEFGDLTIKNDRGRAYHKLNIIEKFGEVYHEYAADILSKVLRENLICIGTLSGCNDMLYMSEEGKFYCDYGYLGNDKHEIWDLVLGTDNQNFHNRAQSFKKLGLYDQISEELQKEIEEDI